MGVLALQGDFLEHSEALKSLGILPRLVRMPGDLDGLEGLILPGGESTTISLLLSSSGLKEELQKRDDLAIFGTCAGMILMAKVVLDGRSDQFSFSYMDISVKRNGFGRQIKSFEEDLLLEGIGLPPMRAVFIRAPVIESVGAGVHVLAEVEYDFGGGETRRVPAVVREGRYLASAYHPELTGDNRLHAYFVDKVLGS